MNTKGFTLLEVTLFLAISGALGLIAFLGLGPRLRNVRFTQSVRFVENTVNSQFKASTSGQNMRPVDFVCETTGPAGALQITASPGGGPAGSSKNCVVNGKMVFFEADKMTFYSIVSRRTGTVGSCSIVDTLVELQTCFKPQLAGLSAGQPPLPEIVTYNSGVTAQFPVAPNTSYRGYGYIQSPNGVRQYPFFFLGNSVNSATAQLSSAATTASGSLQMCLDLSNRRAQLTVAENTVNPVISLKGCTI